MDGTLEGISVDLLKDDVEVGPSLTLTDVSKAKEWLPLIGNRISSIGISSQVSDDSGIPTLWALRFSLESEVSFVAALGEIDELGLQAHLGYMPDCLIVIFEQNLAEMYEITASESNAWGNLLE
jgi:hypothetical protein